MKRFYFFLLLAIPAVLPLESFIEKPNPVQIEADTICFSRDILPLLNSNCAMSGCHNSSNAGGYNFTTASGISKGVKAGSPTTSTIYRQINQGSMPPAPWKKVPDSLKTRLANWITAGAKTAACTETSCDTSNVTYLKDIKPMIQTACVGCHQTNSAEGGFNISVDATNEKNKVQIYNAVAHIGSSMPRNIASLTPCQVAKFRIWALGIDDVANEAAVDESFRVVQSGGDEVLRFQLQSSTSAAIALYSADGRTLMNLPTTNYNAGYNEVRLNTSVLSHGLYMIRFVSPERVRSLKFMR